MSLTNGTSNGSTKSHSPSDHTVAGFDHDIFSKVADLVHNVSISRQEWLRKRLSPDPRRDVYDECGYIKSPSAEQYRDAFDRNPIAGRVVDFMPTECFAYPCYVYEDDDPETATEFEMAWDEVGSALRGEYSWYKKEKGNPIWEYLKRADIYSGIGSYGVILLGFNDVKTEDGLEKPVKRRKYVAPNRPKGEDEEDDSEGSGETQDASGPNEEDMDSEYDTESLTTKNLKVTPPPSSTDPERDAETDTESTGDPLYYAKKKGPKLNFIRVFPETLAVINRYETDPISPRFGLPVEYNITFNDWTDISTQSGIGMNTTTKKVHWTRVIHVAEELASNEVHGTPRMKSVLNNIHNIEKVYSADAEGFWKACFTILSAETHPTLGGDEIDINKTEMRDMFEAMMNGLQRYGVFQGMTLKSIAPSVEDPTAHIAAQVEIICIRKGWPIRIFKGSERGELASSQDEKAHMGRVMERCNNYLTPKLLIPLIDRLIWAGVLPEPKEYCVEWEDTTKQTALEKAEVFGKMMDGFSKAIQGGVDQMIPPRSIMTEFAGIEEEKADQMLEEAVAHVEEKMDQEIKATQKKVDEGVMLDPTKPPPGKVPPGGPPKTGAANPPAFPVKNVFCPTGEGGGQDPTCSPGGSRTGTGKEEDTKGSTPKGPKSDVTVDTSNPKIKEVMAKTFGKDVDTDTLASACNALPGAKVTVALTPGGGAVQVTVHNPNGAALRTFYKDGEGKLVCRNDYFANKDVPGQPKVSGADMLNDQVKSLQKMGVDRIETNAARDDAKGLVGYKVWPKLGYDGQIPDATFAKLPPEVRQAMGEKQGKLFGLVGGQKGDRNIVSLYQTPGGKEAWEKNGDSIPMTFDVKPGSENVKRLEKYLKARDAKNKESTKNVFCPTGAGGGVDPTCGDSASSNLPKKGDSVRINGEEWIYKFKLPSGSHMLTRDNSGMMVTTEELISGKKGVKPTPRTIIKAGDSIDVEHYSGTKSYTVSSKVAALLNSEDWEKGWPADLLTAADGKRRGAFSTANLAPISKDMANKMRTVFKKYELDADVYDGKKGVVVVAGSSRSDPEVTQFVKLAKKYVNGKVRLKDFTAEEHRLLGKWLGYPESSTEKYLTDPVA